MTALLRPMLTRPPTARWERHKALLQPLPRWHRRAARRVRLSESRRLNNQAQISPPISGRARNQTHAFWHQFSHFSLNRCSPGMPPSPENRILGRKGVKNVPARPPPPPPTQPHLFCAFFSPGLCNRKGA